MIAVITPIGISCGATIVRASRSASTMNVAPTSTPTGSVRRWSEPTVSRTMCGTTSPTNPITPLTATASPAISDVTRNRLRRSARDLDAERGRRLGAHRQRVQRPGLREQVDHRRGQRERGAGQLRPGRVAERPQQPEQHRLGRLRVAPEDQEARHRLEQARQHDAAQRQLQRRQPARPGARRRTPRSSPRARRGSLPNDSAHRPSEANAPNSSTVVAPTLAPEEIPSRNGSASALRTSTCTTRPGRRQRRTDDGRQQHPRQPDLPHDRVGGRCRGCPVR